MGIKGRTTSLLALFFVFLGFQNCAPPRSLNIAGNGEAYEGFSPDAPNPTDNIQREDGGDPVDGPTGSIPSPDLGADPFPSLSVDLQDPNHVCITNEGHSIYRIEVFVIEAGHFLEVYGSNIEQRFEFNVSQIAENDPVSLPSAGLVLTEALLLEQDLYISYLNSDGSSQTIVYTCN